MPKRQQVRIHDQIKFTKKSILAFREKLKFPNQSKLERIQI